MTDMYSAFYNKTTFNGELSNCDSSSVGDMIGMFSGASSFNQDLSNWDGLFNYLSI